MVERLLCTTAKENWKLWIDYNYNRKWMFIVNIKDLIGETTEYDKNLALEEKKPKSWC